MGNPTYHYAPREARCYFFWGRAEQLERPGIMDLGTVQESSAPISTPIRYGSML
jgi:hypothetical protein